MCCKMLELLKADSTVNVAKVSSWSFISTGRGSPLSCLVRAVKGPVRRRRPVVTGVKFHTCSKQTETVATCIYRPICSIVCVWCVYTYIHMAVDRNPCCHGAPPLLLQTFVAGPLLQTLVADLCVEYCSLQGACRGGVCRRTPPSATNLCREWPPKPVTRPMFLIHCHISIHTHMYITKHACMHTDTTYTRMSKARERERERERETDRDRERARQPAASVRNEHDRC